MLLSENLKIHESDTWVKTRKVLDESYSARERLSMKTLFEEVVSVIAENQEFEYRDQSLILNFF